MPPRQSAPTPAFQRIKEDILSRIRSGEWQEGEMIPGETTLAQTFDVSRMTVNRALRELTADQILTRVQGSGTFVAQQKYQATLVAIRNIAEEVAARGHRHRAERTSSSACAPPRGWPRRSACRPGARCSIR